MSCGGFDLSDFFASAQLKNRGVRFIRGFDLSGENIIIFFSDLMGGSIYPMFDLSGRVLYVLLL